MGLNANGYIFSSVIVFNVLIIVKSTSISGTY